jgi:enoyl-CoA hydratase
MLAGGPVALRYTLRAVYSGLDVSLEESLGLEADLFGRCFETQDMREGTSAFLEKRPPRFQGT